MTTFSFGPASLRHLQTCRWELQTVAAEALRNSPYDFAITEGHRSLERQAELFRQGLTHIDGKGEPGMHNLLPAWAFDFMPYPARIAGDDDVWTEGLWRFEVIAGVILATGRRLGIQLRWGGDWDGDGTRRDQSLHDRPHIEFIRHLTEEKKT